MKYLKPTVIILLILSLATFFSPSRNGLKTGVSCNNQLNFQSYKAQRNTIICSDIYELYLILPAKIEVTFGFARKFSAFSVVKHSNQHNINFVNFINKVIKNPNIFCSAKQRIVYKLSPESDDAYPSA